jgi:hypothetical protein
MNAAAPEGLPAGGSGTWIVNTQVKKIILKMIQEKNWYPTDLSFPRISSAGRHSGGAAAPGALTYSPIYFHIIFEDCRPNL